MFTVGVVRLRKHVEESGEGTVEGVEYGSMKRRYSSIERGIEMVYGMNIVAGCKEEWVL